MNRNPGVAFAAVLIGGALSVAASAAHAQAADVLPLPEAKPLNAAMVELGRYLFFDVRLSGDAALSCASCHDPGKGWTDGQALGRAYPASEGFRNTPSIVNARYRARFMWDGRLDGSDIGTLVRDMITEAHTMNMDSRLMQERLKQVPEYHALWQKFRKDDINGMRVYGVVGEFVNSLVSRNVPFDRFKQGDTSAISAEARQGYELFRGKAGCVACHNGVLASDGKFHRTGVPENPAITAEPLRHITMLRHYSTSGMPNYMNQFTDVGLQAITKNAADRGKFLTPSLRDLKYTAPYMHNGMFATLGEVVDFYDRGGGAGSELKPLGLAAAEKRALAAFLESLSGDPVIVEPVKSPPYQVRVFGRN
jgi:cytochrome c peroxidase